MTEASLWHGPDALKRLLLYRPAIVLDPASLDAHNGLAVALEMCGNHQAAGAEYGQPHSGAWAPVIADVAARPRADRVHVSH